MVEFVLDTIQRSSVQLLPAFKTYPMNIPGKTFVSNACIWPWSFDDWPDVHKVSDHLQVNVAYFTKNNNTPWLLPNGFLAVQTEPVLAKFLLSLVVQTVLHCHVFLLCAEFISHDSNSAHRKLKKNRELSEKMDLETSLSLLSWFEFEWITLNPLPRQVLHDHCTSLMQSRLLLFIQNLVVCSDHITKSSAILNLSARSPRLILHGALVTFVRLHTSQFGSLGKLVNKLCFPLDLFEVGFAEGCADGGIAGGGMATSAGDTSVELEDRLVNPSVNGWSHSGNFVSTRRSWSPTACAGLRSPRHLIWCSVAYTQGTTRECGCRCYTRCSPILDETWWLTWLSIIRVTVYSHNLPNESIAGDSFNNWTCTNMPN